MAEKTKILIADDKDSLRTLVRAVLEAEDKYLIEEAIDGDEVMIRIKAQKPDILILDIMMPGQSGFEVCEKIKQTAELKDIKVIILTEKGQVTEEKWAKSIGADHFISKPFSPLELLELVNNISSKASA